MNNNTKTPELIGKFKFVLIHSIDLYAFLDTESKKEFMVSWRTNNNSLTVFKEYFDNSTQGLGSFNLTVDKFDISHNRRKISLEHYDKSILTQIFYKKGIPLLFEEKDGSKLSSLYDFIKLGKNIQISELLNIKSKITIRYDECELRVFNEGIFSFRFEFSGENMPIETFISLSNRLKQLTKEATFDKLKLILDDLSHKAKFSALKIKSHLSQDSNILFYQFCASQTLLFTDSLKSTDLTVIPITQLESEPNFFGLVRHTIKASEYKLKIIESLSSSIHGYKNDEIYVNIRSVTVIVLPNHWNPDDYLSVYLSDLTLLIEYYISKISYLDGLSHSIDELEVDESLPDDALTSKYLVEKIIRLRKILLKIEEGVDVDLVINHYFTRNFILQLIEQRGVYNKLDAIKRKTNNLDKIYDLLNQSSTANIGISLESGQLKFAIWGFFAATILSLISLILTLLQ